MDAIQFYFYPNFFNKLLIKIQTDFFISVPDPVFFEVLIRSIPTRIRILYFQQNQRILDSKGPGLIGDLNLNPYSKQCCRRAPCVSPTLSQSRTNCP